MMPDKRRAYTAEFKRDAIHLVTEQGYTVAEAARNLGLNPHMLQRWKRELVEREHAAFPGNGRVSPAHEELYRLQEENTRLRMERDSLKKPWPSAVLCEVLDVSRAILWQLETRTHGSAPLCDPTRSES